MGLGFGIARGGRRAEILVGVDELDVVRRVVGLKLIHRTDDVGVCSRSVFWLDLPVHPDREDPLGRVDQEAVANVRLIAVVVDPTLAGCCRGSAGEAGEPGFVGRAQPGSHERLETLASVGGREEDGREKGDREYV